MNRVLRHRASSGPISWPPHSSRPVRITTYGVGVGVGLEVEGVVWAAGDPGADGGGYDADIFWILGETFMGLREEK